MGLRDHNENTYGNSGFDPLAEFNFIPSKPSVEVQNLLYAINHQQQVASESLGPECPPGLEGFIPNIPTQTIDPMSGGGQSTANSEGFGDQVENEAYSQESSFHSKSDQEEEQVPLTLTQVPDTHPDDLSQPCANEDDRLILNEEDLVEAQITWDMGKEMGFRVSDEKAMLKALLKVKEVQDCCKEKGTTQEAKGSSAKLK